MTAENVGPELRRDTDLEQKMLEAVIADRNDQPRNKQLQVGPSSIGGCRELLRASLFEPDTVSEPETHWAAAAHVGSVVGADLESIFGRRLGALEQQRMTTLFENLGLKISGAIDLLFIDDEQVTDLKSTTAIGGVLYDLKKNASAIETLLSIWKEGLLYGKHIETADGGYELTEAMVSKMSKLSYYVQVATYVTGAKQQGILGPGAQGRLVFYDRAGDYQEFVALVITAEEIELFYEIAQHRVEQVVNAQEAFEGAGGNPAVISGLRDMTPSFCFSPKVQCFAADEEVVTRQGIRPIGELAREGLAELLVPNGSGQGRWEVVPVRDYGVDEIIELHLRHGQKRKVVRTTAAHQWFVVDYFRSGPMRSQEVRRTSELVPGDRLKSIRAKTSRTKRVPFAQTQGFVFGDGSKSSVTFAPRSGDKIADVMPLFTGIGCRFSEYDRDGEVMLRTRDIPSLWKELPDMRESVSTLLSWVSGYFAADGTVTKDGTARLYSVRREHLESVRSILTIAGVRTSPIITKVRDLVVTPQGTEYRGHALHGITIRSEDLPEWFFIQRTHSERAASVNHNGQRSDWIVEKVVPTGVRETVYCAEVPEVEAFALADGLLTHNCPRRMHCWGGSDWTSDERITNPDQIHAVDRYVAGRDMAKIGEGMKKGAREDLREVEGVLPDGRMVTWTRGGSAINVVETTRTEPKPLGEQLDQALDIMSTPAEPNVKDRERELKKLTVSGLHNILTSDYDLSTEGKKAELIARILEHEFPEQS